MQTDKQTDTHADRQSTPHRCVGSSLKLGKQKGGLLLQSWEREPITGSGAEPPVEVQGEPTVEGMAVKSPSEADGILVLEDTFLHCPGACNGSRSDRSDQTEAYI